MLWFDIYAGTGIAAPSQVKASIATSAAVGIGFVIFVIFLIIVDVSCYFLNGCGLTMFLCVHVCEKIQPQTKEKDMEIGERFKILVFHNHLCDRKINERYINKVK